MSTTLNGDGTIVLESSEPGRVVVPQPSRLKRLNYFDGKFLRADDLRLEQDYLRRLVHVSNQAGGPGVVMGLDTTLGGGDALRIGPGQAIDGEGRVLLLTQPVELGLAELIEASRAVAPGDTVSLGAGSAAFGPCEVASAAPPVTVADGGTLYVIWLGHAEALCGEEDVFGKLCEAACVTSADRPYRLEAVVVRALPLSLTLPPAPGGVIPFHNGHLRSRVASAYYADEWTRGGSLISAAGLALQTWCLGSHPDLGLDVPIALVGLSGSAPLFLDQWIVRRERYEPPARRYWAGRMAMRPWPVYLAQILQFQCQLAEVIGGGGAPGTPDPCGEALEEAKRFIASIEADVRGEARSAERVRLLERLDRATVARAATSGEAALLDGGIVETPSAGYLPVRISTSETVNDQVTAWLGEGVDLRFCVVRPDFVAHALEEAQHMERIPLLPGLVDETQKPLVDVLVPNGQPLGAQLTVEGIGWDTTIGAGDAAPEAPQLKGVTRTEHVEEGGGAVHFAGGLELDIGVDESEAQPVTEPPAPAEPAPAAPTVEGDVDPTAAEVTSEPIKSRVADVPSRFRPHRAAAQLWFTASSLEDVFTKASGSVPIRAELSVAATVGPLSAAASAKLFGDLEIVSNAPLGTTARQVQVVFTGTAQLILPGGPDFPSFPLGELELLLTLSRPAAGVRRLEIEAVPPPGQGVSLPERVGVRVEWSGTPRVATISTGSLGEITVDDDQLRSLTARSSFLRRLDVAGLRARAASRLETGERVTFVTAREDSAILQPGDGRRVKAESAIERIGCLLWDDAFAPAALAKLFPAPTLTESGQPILPTLDWVLFHRRRDKDCGPAPLPPVVPPPPPPPVPVTACHEVFKLNDPATIERVQELIQKGALAEAERLLTRLGTVTFAEGSSTVADGGTVVSRWGTAPPPVNAWPYWVAGETGVGDQPLVEARAGAVAALVGATKVGVFGGEVTGPLPPCGVWTLLEPQAEAPPTTVRHEVYYLRQDSDFDLIERLRKEPRIVEAIAAGEVPHEGHAVFESGQATIVDAESSLPPLPFTWQPDAYEVLVFRGPVDVSGEPIDSQGKAIAGRLVDERFNETFNVTVLDAATQDDWPVEASVISVVSVTG